MHGPDRGGGGREPAEGRRRLIRETEAKEDRAESEEEQHVRGMDARVDDTVTGGVEPSPRVVGGERGVRERTTRDGALWGGKGDREEVARFPQGTVLHDGRRVIENERRPGDPGDKEKSGQGASQREKERAGALSLETPSHAAGMTRRRDESRDGTG